MVQGAVFDKDLTGDVKSNTLRVYSMFEIHRSIVPPLAPRRFLLPLLSVLQRCFQIRESLQRRGGARRRWRWRIESRSAESGMGFGLGWVVIRVEKG